MQNLPSKLFKIRQLFSKYSIDSYLVPHDDAHNVSKNIHIFILTIKYRVNISPPLMKGYPLFLTSQEVLD